LDAKILKALGDPKRYALLELMSRRGYCVSALARLTCLSESAVSQHLKVLREAGLVHGVKKGYYTHYDVDRTALDGIIAALTQLRDSENKPCNDPFYGCSEAEYIDCKAYVPPEKRTKEE